MYGGRRASTRAAHIACAQLASNPGQPNTRHPGGDARAPKVNNSTVISAHYATLRRANHVPRIQLDLNLFAANWYEGAQYQVPRDRVDDFELVADQHVD